MRRLGLSFALSLIRLVGCLGVVAGGIRTALLYGNPQVYDLALLAVCFALFSSLPMRLPSGTWVHPGRAVMVASIFLLPLPLAVLVPVPGLLVMALLRYMRWREAVQSIGSAALSVTLGSLSYHLLRPEGHVMHLPGMLPGALAALLVHELALIVANAAALAYGEERSLLAQFRFMLERDLNWGQLALSLVGLTTALAYVYQGVWGLLLQIGLLFCVSPAIHYFTQAEKWQQAAWTDGLTGIQNRSAWEEFLRVMRERPDPGTLAMIDLNGFKAVNDRHGHVTGDALLREVAAGLRCSLRTTDRLFRYGGDEFVVFVHHAAGSESVVRERITALVDQIQADWNARGFWVTASLGMASLPSEAQELEELLRLADARMYAHKAGRASA